MATRSPHKTKEAAKQFKESSTVVGGPGGVVRGIMPRIRPDNGLGVISSVKNKNPISLKVIKDEAKKVKDVVDKFIRVNKARAEHPEMEAMLKKLKQ